MKNKKLLLAILGVIFTAILVVGSSFALWSWASNNSSATNVTFTTTADFSCSVDGGGNITEVDIKLVPTTCDNSEYVIKREITTNVVNNKNIPIYMDLWLDIKKLSQGLSDSHNFRYALTTSSTSCSEGNILSFGNFNGKEVNDKIELTINDKYSTVNSKTYYLYIWLDYYGIDRTSQEEEFDLELGGECMDNLNSDRVYEANKPYVYNTGLIPVKLSSSGDTVTTVREDDPEWYSYTEEDKKWANAILVTDTNRDKYKNYPGTIVNQEDILAYYVWIPRYSYKVWRLSGVSSNSENHSIDIKFIPTTIIDELPTATQKYYTHPAFSFGSKELSGIWVGKFEVSHSNSTLLNSTTANSLGTCTESSCANYTGLRILPEKLPLRYNSISRFFYASQHMSDENNLFGLSSTSVDSHMIKNSEWGAVAYLSRSKYGINGEITMNYASSATGIRTGRGKNVSNYGEGTSYSQSTTGNVTGIFDMSGGEYDYVMGVHNNTIASSGFSTMPDAKYYNSYPNPPFDGTYSTNNGKCTFEYCGGHALNEIASWYSDAYRFVNSTNQWFIRGGNYRDNVANGIFYYYDTTSKGASSADISTHYVLTGY